MSVMHGIESLAKTLTPAYPYFFLHILNLLAGPKTVISPAVKGT